MTPTPSQTLFPRHAVTAVLVAHDGIRWVHRALDAVQGQTRPPDQVRAVDTGSTDDTFAALVAGVGVDRVERLPRDTGFGAAVAHALGSVWGPGREHPADADWVWVLHDDCELAPDALEHLLEVVDRSPSIGVAGPKVRGWYDRRLLVEVGITAGRSGRRETGLERAEHDQGQHDGVHDVLAVGSAGMLVRRDVWETLGGFDPVLPLLRDDLDLGWRANLAGHRVVCVTDAVVHHAEAGAHGRRRLAATVNRRHLVDRQHASYLVLVNLPLLGLPLAFVRIVLGSLLRALGLLVGKLPGEAADEVAALGAVLVRPDRVVRGRLARRRTRTLPARAVNGLLAPTGVHLRRGLESVGSVLFRGDSAAPARGRHTAVETGPVSDESEDLTLGRGSGLLRQVGLAPATLLVVLTTLITLVAIRDLLGRGLLAGGALLPATGSAADLWSSYLSGWHPVGLGTPTTAPPYLAVLGTLAGPLLGSVGATVGLLVLGAVPLAALSAYLATRPSVGPRLLRVWAAVTYATLPVVTGAVAGGRVGTLLAVVLLPPLLLAASRLPELPERPGSWRATGTAAVLLTLVSAGAPTVWFVAVVLALLGAAALALVARRLLRLETVLRVLTVLLVPVVLLAPWSFQLLAHPARAWREPGLPSGQLSDPGVASWEIALLHPGGPGMYPVLLSLPLLLVGLVALLRRTRRRVTLASWALVLAGTALGVLAPHVAVPAAGGGQGPGWGGVGTLLAGAGLVVAALVGAEGVTERLGESSFGLRQPAVVGLAAVAALAPLVAAGWWTAAGAGGPLHREDEQVLPAFVEAEAAQPDRPRTLVLRGKLDHLQVSLAREHAARIGDGDVAPHGGLSARFLVAVGGLLSGRDDAVARLQPYAVRYVVLAPPVDRALAQRLDGQPGLARVSAEDGTFLWKADASAARVRFVADGAAASDRAFIVAAGQVEAASDLPAGAAAGRLLVADRADPGWRATLDGHGLRPATASGLQTFAVPSGGGAVALSHSPSASAWLRWGQLLVLVLAVLLALPSGRREDDEDLPPEDESPDLVGRRRAPAAGVVA